MGFTCDSNSCYKVVRIPKFEANSNKFSVQIFSSDMGEWNVYEVTCTGDVVWYDSYFSNCVVIVNGVLYWPEGKGRILVYNLNNNSDVQQNRLINFPYQELESEDSYGNKSPYCLGGSEGLLCCARIMKSQKSLSVWVLEEGWQLVHKDLDLHDLVAEMFSKLYVCEFEDWEGAEMQIDYEKRENEAIMDVKVLGFNPVDKNIIILSYHFTVWAYNIQTRRHEVLSEPSFLANTSGNRYKLSDTSYRVSYPFPLQPMPTILLPDT
ncbi:uncharacterized protein LOC113343757 [Papaver somniferum]|uniref:uncharacterized protein LOC113343757 n=1 Tax=Papaver somniferum TaxID=3469 RepID=UPI000E700D43|nr:uncharacterized protein LOC113343757 [Papaver somniferum]